MKPRVMEHDNNLRLVLLMSLEMNLTLISEIQIGCMFNLKLVNIHGTTSSSILETMSPTFHLRKVFKSKGIGRNKI